jgi:hypothetical protein
MVNDPHYRELCRICRRTRASHVAKANGACREFSAPTAATRRTRGPWTCERCGKGDNATRYHNTWEVTVAGELGSDDDPDVGEYDDDFVHELELCDACAKKRDGIVWALAFALRLELAGFEPAENYPEAIEALRWGAAMVGVELGPDHPAFMIHGRAYPHVAPPPCDVHGVTALYVEGGRWNCRACTRD